MLVTGDYRGLVKRFSPWIESVQANERFFSNYTQCDVEPALFFISLKLLSVLDVRMRYPFIG